MIQKLILIMFVGELVFGLLEDFSLDPDFTNVSSEVESDGTICRCSNAARRRIKGTRIIGGDPVVKDYPFMVGVIEFSDGAWFGDCWKYLGCGAMILNAKQVLTAAHCIPENGWVYLVAGISDLSQCVIGNAVFRNVSKVTLHGEFNSETFENDLAILELSEPLDFSNPHLGPVCLPQDDHFKSPSGTYSLLGWGLTKEGDIGAQILQETEVNEMTFLTCQEMYRTDNIHPVSWVKQLCTTGPGRGACIGDSGGPVLSEGLILEGVISWGPRNCTTLLPSVHTKVSHYIDWINQQTGNNICTIGDNYPNKK